MDFTRATNIPQNRNKMDRLEYNKLPVFKYGHILQNCIESIEFDNNLIGISDTEGDSDDTDFDPIYSEILSTNIPTSCDLQSFRDWVKDQNKSKSTTSQSEVKPKSQSQEEIGTKPNVVKDISSQSTGSIRDFLQVNNPVDTIKKTPVLLEQTAAIVGQAWKMTNPKTVKRVNLPFQAKLQVSPKKVPRKRQPKPSEPTGFSTAKDQLLVQIKKDAQSVADYKAAIRHLGLPKLQIKSATNKFKSPLMVEDQNNVQKLNNKPNQQLVDEKLKGIDEKLLERIKNDVIERTSSMSWEDIKGLEFAKRVIQETIIFPILRPDLFTGFRRPPKGVLLFGPPGNGKTLITKCIASTAAAMFFNISASSLTSKWIGEGEMLVRALFTYARVNQPAIVFIDEVESLLSRYSESEHASSRRLKTEFMVFLDGADTGDNERILIIGATSRPQELDDVVRRRFTKRLYIPLPNEEARRGIITHHLKEIEHELTDSKIDQLARETEGYSGADIKTLSQEASMIPLRQMLESKGFNLLNILKKDGIPRVGYQHFKMALAQTKPSVSEDDIKDYVEWNKKFGSG